MDVTEAAHPLGVGLTPLAVFARAMRTDAKPPANRFAVVASDEELRKMQRSQPAARHNRASRVPLWA